jgi:hypothetical protein
LRTSCEQSYQQTPDVDGWIPEIPGILKGAYENCCSFSVSGSAPMRQRALCAMAAAFAA